MKRVVQVDIQLPQFQQLQALPTRQFLAKKFESTEAPSHRGTIRIRSEV